MIKDLVKTKDRVKDILEKYPSTRDSDKQLWLAYNCIYNGLKEVIEEGNYQAFKGWLCHPETPVFESLSRARRKIQEKHPELAGKKDIRMEEAGLVRDWSKE